MTESDCRAVLVPTPRNLGHQAQTMTSPGSAPALPDPIPDPLVELLAGRLRVIGDQTRIRVLDRLRHSPASVQELVDAAGTSQQNVSKHMTRLIEHGLVARERDGNEHRYRLIDQTPIEVLELLSADLADQLRRLADMIGHSE